jgi:hypothetical protein
LKLFWFKICFQGVVIHFFDRNFYKRKEYNNRYITIVINSSELIEYKVRKYGENTRIEKGNRQ